MPVNLKLPCVAITQEYIASCGVVHRDLACRNLLLASDDLVKIADFGFACSLDGRQCIVKDLPAESKPFRWMSPEAFEQNVYSEASDVLVGPFVIQCRSRHLRACIVHHAI